MRCDSDIARKQREMAYSARTRNDAPSYNPEVEDEIKKSVDNTRF
jgi:hypothetical protein